MHLSDDVKSLLLEKLDETKEAIKQIETEESVDARVTLLKRVLDLKAQISMNRSHTQVVVETHSAPLTRAVVQETNMDEEPIDYTFGQEDEDDY